MQGLPNDIWSDPGLDGKYRFERPLSSGAMAIVVVASHLELDEKVVIKFLSSEALRSNAAMTRFRREAKAAAKIKNHHVVRIIDVATTESGIPYFVMEYLDGKDLERLLAQYPERRAPIGDAVDFVLQASEAVIEGHSLGIVHRDLKPANLFCVDRGDGYPMIKVLDFGISKFTTALGDTERTDKHEILGSPRYMSPEQITSAWNVDQRTDIWALGVILYEAIAGRAPFRDDLIPELWRKIRQELPEPLNELRPDCPEALSAVVLKCLEKDPTQRYADLSQLARDLAPFAPERSRSSIARIRWTVDSSNDVSTRPSSYSDSYNRPTTHRDHRRRRPTWLYAGGLVAALGFTAAIAVTQRTAPNAKPARLAVESRPANAAETPLAPGRQPNEPTISPSPGPSLESPIEPAPAGAPVKKPPASKPPASTASSPGLDSPAPTDSNPAAAIASSKFPWLVPPVNDRK